MSTGYSVKLSQAADGVQIHIGGPKAKHIDAKLLEACMHAVLQCADVNACLSEGLRITDKCIETIAKHDEAAKCLSHGLGLAARR